MTHTIERSAEEIAEIERHKYFLSEKAGHDVGWDHAEQDWEARYASEFRGRQAKTAAPERGISMLFKKLFSN